MRIMLLDSALRGDGGHHDHFASGLARRCRADARELVILGHHEAKAGPGGSRTIVPAFSRSLYDGVATDPYDGLLTDCLATSRSFAVDLDAAGLSVRDDDLLLIPTATPGELLGLADWLDRQPAAPRVAALFHWGDATWLRPGSLHAALQRFAIRRIAANRDDRLHLSATHRALSDALTTIAGTRVTVAASATFFENPLPPPRTAPAVANIGILGALRDAKGEAVVPAVVSASIRSAVPARWIIQCHGLPMLPERYRALAELPGVTLLRDRLDEAELLALLATLDVVLLPYDPPTYRAMVSGVFTLAAGYGVPCIVPGGTWMSARIDAGEAAGVTYRAGTTASIVEAVAAAVTDERRASLGAAARDRAADWRRHYCADRYVDELSHWANGRAARPIACGTAG